MSPRRKGSHPTVQHIVNCFGEDATKAHTLQPNSNKNKELDEINLHELKQSIIKNAESVSLATRLESVRSLLDSPFDWGKTVEANVTDLLLTKAAHLETMGIKIPKPLIVLVVMAQWEKAVKSDGTWADDLRYEFRNVRALYAVDHEHDDALYKVVLEHLNKADKKRNTSAMPHHLKMQ